MLTAETALALFLMLAISSVSLLIAQKIRVPHTVLLVAIGVVLATVSHFPYLGFLGGLTLTPELLFFIFLPTLIFESAYNINIKHLSKDAVIIGILSIISLSISAIIIAFGLDFALGFLDIHVPMILLLIFGAIISATDPVAVLALFKEYGAPRRLSLIFEGESIFNDGTAVALFLVLLTIAESGTFVSSDVTHGFISFIGMVVGGVIFGLLFGGLFAKLIGWSRSNEFAAITLTMVLAHMTFICAELFSHHVTIGGSHVYVSSIIATAVASLLMGNYGRYKMPAHASEFVEKYWSQFAFLANSLVFIMIGMLTIQLPESAPELLLPIGITILIVAIARVLAIYPIVTLFNIGASNERKIPRSWQHVLAWGSLRGALAVTMVLMIPDNLSFEGWTLPYTPKEFILALTVGCVFATLFIKATTIGALMKHLNLSTFTSVEKINYQEMLIYIYTSTLTQIRKANEKGHINDETYTLLKEEQEARTQKAFTDLKGCSDAKTIEKVIHLYAIGIERKHVKSLYSFGEISETVVRKITNKLEYQSDAIEHDKFDSKYTHGSERDIFEILAEWFHILTFKKKSEEETITDTYLYYRALSIISRKVTKELGMLNACFTEAFKTPHETVAKISEMYTGYREGSIKKMEEIQKAHPALIRKMDISLAHRSVEKRELDMLESLYEREMVTPKVAIALEEHFALENKA